jgi:hypothetical protein
MKLIYEEPYSAGGRFQISEGPDGLLGMSVTGAIGVDDQNNIGAKVRPSLVETYRALFAGKADVPSRVSDLEARFQEQYRASMAATANVGSSITKSEADFDNTTCKTFNINGTNYYTVLPYCTYAAATYAVLSPLAFSTGNVSFFWNDGPRNLKHYNSGTGTAYSNVQPYHWGWNYWNGTFSGAFVEVYDPNYPNNLSNLGVTIHKP